MTNKEKAKELRRIAHYLSVWKESGPEGPEHSKEARKSAEEAMKLLGANADLLHNCKETYGVKYRQSNSPLKSLNGILDDMRINNQPTEFITERIGYYDYQDFAQEAFIDQLNRWADELEKEQEERILRFDKRDFSKTVTRQLLLDILYDKARDGVECKLKSRIETLKNRLKKIGKDLGKSDYLKLAMSLKYRDGYARTTIPFDQIEFSLGNLEK